MKLGAEGTRHSVLDLPKAEKQQRHRAEQIDADNDRFH